MKQKSFIKFITPLLIVLAITLNPIFSYASEHTPYPYFDSDPDELRLINLQGELKLDYFEPEKTQLKTETILCTPTSAPQHIQYMFTYAYEYDALGNTILSDSKEFEKGTTLTFGKTYLYTYNTQNQITSYALTNLGLRWGVLTPTNASYQFNYNKLNHLKSFSYQYPTYTGKGTYSYNEYNQLQNITYRSNGDTFLENFSYDTLGHCIEYCGYTNNQLAFQNFYTYNEQNQIATFRSITYLENNAIMSDKHYQFTYDAHGNIASAVITKNYTNKRTDTSTIICQNQYDALNRLIARTAVYSGSGSTYSYIYEYYN